MEFSLREYNTASFPHGLPMHKWLYGLRLTLEKLSKQNEQSCNALSMGYVRCRMPYDASKLHKKLKVQGVSLNVITFFHWI